MTDSMLQRPRPGECADMVDAAAVHETATNAVAAPVGWAVVATHSRKESYAARQLEHQGFIVYAPKYQKRPSVTRPQPGQTGLLFPGYLFVRASLNVGAWRSISNTFGVRRVLSFGRQPALLPDGFIADLQAREVGGVIRRTTSLVAGDAVRIGSGAFEGLFAEVLSVDAEDRVVLLLEFMQRAVVAKFDGAVVTKLKHGGASG